MSHELQQSESKALAEHEAVIERGLNTFVEVGTALLAIRERRLYRADHSTFEDYCRQRWGFSDSRARQLITAAQTVTNVTATGLPAPENEGQARELARVPEGRRAEVWRETVERTNGRPTATAVRETYSPPAPVTPAAPPISADEIAELRSVETPPAPQEEPQRRRRPITDQATDAGWEIRKAAERVARLLGDDRFQKNEEQVALSLRAHLLFVAETVAAALEKLGDPHSTERINDASA